MFNCGDADGEVMASVASIVTQLEHMLHSRVLCLCLDLTDPNDYIGDRAAEELIPHLQKIGRVPTLTVILNSGGGDINAAYHVAKMLREAAEELVVLVPRWAKSAATFLCLAADRILLGPRGELGPLDTQIPDPRGMGRHVSALSIFKSLEYLYQYSLEVLDSTTQLILIRSGMNLPRALEEARPLVSSVVRPLYEQVDPMLLGEASRWLSVGEEYSIRVMDRYAYAGRPGEVRRIVRSLVRDYPSHEFVIDYAEACSLGLMAEPLDQLNSEASLLADLLIRSAPRVVGCLPLQEEEIDETGDTHSGDTISLSGAPIQVP